MRETLNLSACADISTDKKCQWFLKVFILFSASIIQLLFISTHLTLYLTCHPEDCDTAVFTVTRKLLGPFRGQKWFLKIYCQVLLYWTEINDENKKNLTHILFLLSKSSKIGHKDFLRSSSVTLRVPPLKSEMG